MPAASAPTALRETRARFLAERRPGARPHRGPRPPGRPRRPPRRRRLLHQARPLVRGRPLRPAPARPDPRPARDGGGRAAALAPARPRRARPPAARPAHVPARPPRAAPLAGRGRPRCSPAARGRRSPRRTRARVQDLWLAGTPGREPADLAPALAPPARGAPRDDRRPGADRAPDPGGAASGGPLHPRPFRRRHRAPRSARSSATRRCGGARTASRRALLDDATADGALRAHRRGAARARRRGRRARRSCRPWTAGSAASTTTARPPRARDPATRRLAA